jgi:hypothetical protein
MREVALLFGRGKGLAGVVTEPPHSGNGAGRLGFVALNAGLVHRVGPNRLHVKLTRELAQRGFVSMRFDHSGIGDSPPRADARSFAQATLDETRECMDYLESSHGVNRFVLFGICSGADNALRTARDDARVAGAVLVEPHAVPTFGYLFGLYRHRLRSPLSWFRFLTGKSEAWLELVRWSSVKRSTGSTKVSEEFMAPSRRDFVEAARAIGGRRSRLLLVYSNGSASHHFYRGVRRRIRPLLDDGLVAERLVDGSDHIFTHPATQASLFEAVLAWADRLASRAES